MTHDDASFAERFSPEEIASRLRALVEGSSVDPGLDELEMRYLIEILMRSSLLLSEGYDSATLDRILAGERRPSTLIEPRESGRSGSEEHLARVWSVPDVLRTYGDKCLYDVGLAGRTIFRGIDLFDLGPRSYGLASKVLALLARDRTLRDFYDRNLMERLPIEEEILFLRQCSSRFSTYAHILQEFRGLSPWPQAPAGKEGGAPVPARGAAASAAPVVGSGGGPRAEQPAAPQDPIAIPSAAATGDERGLDRGERLTRYERQILLSSLDVPGLRLRLKEEIVDQNGAVDRFCDDLSVFALGTRPRPRPQSYLLVGPTGVGKNYLIETLVRLLEEVWSTEIPFLTLEGPQYTYPSDVSELKGSTRGFIRSDEEGLLAEFHEKARHAPLSFVLIDEIEKAHPQLARFFLAIMDRGTTMDNKGRLLRFPATVLAYTSNLGYSEESMRGDAIGYGGPGRRAGGRAAASRTLKRGLPPEFLNRLKVIHFAPLSRASAERILDQEIARIAARYVSRHGIELAVTSAAREAIVDRGFSAEQGARHLAAEADRICNVEVSIRLQRHRGPIPEETRRLVARIREAREGQRPMNEASLVSEVRRHTRLQGGPGRVTVDHRDGRFVYGEDAP